MTIQSHAQYPGAGDLKIAIVTNSEPLDVAYGLSPEQAAFFKGEIKINDDKELETHILKVQVKAYKIFPYACIRWFTFLHLGFAAQPEYERIIKLGQERPDGFLLDIGCCFGVDARKAVADGFPLRNVVTSDLRKGFYEMGHTLFNTTPETYPIAFVPGDAFDPDMLQVVPPFKEPPTTERPNLSTLTSLNLLAGRCTAIYASYFFQLFSEEKQFHLAKALAGLLSPEPGSTICGEHGGNTQKGIFGFGGKEVEMFQHCPESWRALWDGEVFAKGTVRVNAQLDPVEKSGTSMTYLRLRWSVMRL